MKVIVVGASGHGREVLDVVEACGHDVLGVVDDGDPDRALLERRGVVFLGDTRVLSSHGDASVVLGIGDSGARRSVAEALGAIRWLEPIVHPLASVGSDVDLGAGTVLAAGARLTTHIVVGPHGYVGPNATIGHDCVLGSGVTVLPGATVSGAVTIGDGAMIGTGANVRQGVYVGEGSIVGAGAVVVSDVERRSIVIGVPARPRS